MFANPEFNASRPIAVLLGGSGHARPPVAHVSVVPALLKPLPDVDRRSGTASEPCAEAA
ncbi:hypothetical protein P3W85_00540 [Cupriavidus basilensis]|uniref:Uncharacterized protein n=1 Tax=Cupriavidus basilensis TaxID=68895 RepID=A0ABT6AFS9_9BURK|nr:hypothetical protein [Cupriavidus basilensis]MDF3831456.1 hypothetical protein [Cupriavidus basilensis]